MRSWKKMLVVFTLALLFSVTVGALFVGLAVANPFYYAGDVPPDSQTYPPLISIRSPENNTAYAVNHVSLDFNVTAPQSKTAYSTAIMQVSYKADWMKNPYVAFDQIYNLDPYKRHLAFHYELFSIPEGNHSILIQAIGKGAYVQYGTIPNIAPSFPISTVFYINSSSIITFTVDTTAPFVSVLSVENKTYDKTSIPINFTVNEPATQITYSLDGAENVTISGNLTLNGLLDGVHSLTVYAKDHAGNVGASETINFTITTPKTEPPPTMPIAATATAVSTAAAVAGLLAYHRKRH